ncbi:MAG: hypothetical protein LBP69_05655 [Treponema sp.]|jgi:hypothetical protein|nr:hypothetical protein [Treponema sp.]
MKKKIILDLCGGTGSWSRPYKEAGYDVRLITMPEYDVREYTPPQGVYGILAAPPCTEFSLAKNGCKRTRNFEAGMELVKACLWIIWTCRIQNTVRFWALENPVGYLRQFLGRPFFTFEQWQFGEQRIKKTDIWGYFTVPKSIVKEKPVNLIRMSPKKRYNSRDWSKLNCPAEYASLKLDRAALRAITPPGFAQAFFKANP